MARLKYTPRMWMILVHDLVATVVAILASFYIRFEESFLAERWDFLLVLMPGIPDLCRRRLHGVRPEQIEVAVHVAARTDEHHQGDHRDGGVASGA